MSSVLQTIEPISEQAYLEGEKLSEIKHEFMDGYVYAMAGASKRHNKVSLNIAMSLNAAARNTPCEVYTSDMKVRIAGRKRYFYPDVVVDCSADDSDDYYLEKPCLIVEVLSKSTEKRDRSEKLLNYMTIPSLKAYLLVEQDQPDVTFFYRTEAGDWEVEGFESLDAVIKLPCPEVELPLAAIYETMNF